MGTAWKVTTRRGVAYVEGWESATRVRAAAGQLSTELKRGAKVEDYLRSTTAVYTDRRGRPFAFLITFDLKQWDAVLAALQSCEFSPQ